MINPLNLRSNRAKNMRAYFLYSLAILLAFSIIYLMVIFKAPIFITVYWNIFKWVLAIVGGVAIVQVIGMFLWENIDLDD